MNKLLNFITNIMDYNNVDYWLDSGTLLGLYRDGKLINGDNDIDIGVKVSEIEKIKNISNLIKQDFGKVLILDFKGKSFKHKYKLYKFNMDVDINIFYKNKKYYYCPQPVNPIINNRIYYLFFKCSKYIYSEIPKYFNVKYDLYKFPFKMIREIKYWIYPDKYFKILDSINLFEKQFFIPQRIEEYLTYRYNNWKIPVDNWDFSNDDGALRNEIPKDEIIV